MRASLVSSLSRKADKAFRQTTRDISVGTNLMAASTTDDDVALQKARSWSMSDAEGSNMAKDNAVAMKDLFEGKTVAFFGVPAPFTGTCSNEHYPPYKTLAEEFKTNGADEIVCYAVSDPYAHYAWSLSLTNEPEQITFLADCGAKFAKTFGLDAVYDDASLGLRSTRFSMIVENGVVSVLNNNIEDASKDAANLLEALISMNEKVA
jgi:peroxiredoxin